MKKIIFILLCTTLVNPIYAQFSTAKKTTPTPTEKEKKPLPPKKIYFNIVTKFSGSSIVGGDFEEKTIPVSTTMLELIAGSPKFFSYIALRVSHPLVDSANISSYNWAVNTLTATRFGIASGFGGGFSKIDPITYKGSSFAVIFTSILDYNFNDFIIYNEGLWDFGFDLMFRYTKHYSRNFGMIFGLNIEYSYKSYHYIDYNFYNFHSTAHAHIISYGLTVGFSF